MTGRHPRAPGVPIGTVWALPLLLSLGLAGCGSGEPGPTSLPGATELATESKAAHPDAPSAAGRAADSSAAGDSSAAADSSAAGDSPAAGGFARYSGAAPLALDYRDSWTVVADTPDLVVIADPEAVASGSDTPSMVLFRAAESELGDDADLEAGLASYLTRVSLAEGFQAQGEPEPLRLAGRDALLATLAHDGAAAGGGLISPARRRLVWYLVAPDGAAWAITATAEEGDWRAQEPRFRAMAESLSFEE